MNPQTKDNKFSPAQRITAVAMVVMLIVVGFVLLMRPEPEAEIAISGLNSIDATAERKTAISKTLYNVLKNNLPPDKQSGVKDAVIRNDSYIDNYDETKDVHYASFIIDMQSIRQSYIAYHEWSSSNQNPNISGYPVMIQCLPKSLLIYGEFDCKPMDTSSEATTPNILYRYLPYHVESKYTVREAATQKDGTTELTVDAYMPGWMAEMSPELLAEYKAEIQAWIRSKGLDSSGYTMNFVY